MSTIINATTTNGVVIQPDNSGSLVLQTNSGTTAVTVDTSQNTTLAGKLTTASSGIQFSDSSTQTAAASPYVLKNRIINGDMRIAQRGTSFSFASGGGTFYYGADRFTTQNYNWSAGSNITVSNDTTVYPTGFNASYKWANGATGLTFGSGGFQSIVQKIEGFNIADCYSKTVTLSFWVRASTAGTYSVDFTNEIASYQRYIVKTYTINTANTWEQKTITVDMSVGTSSGTWNTTNGEGLSIAWLFGTASDRTGNSALDTWTTPGSYHFATTSSVNLATIANSTFYLTGVQLEIGTSATPFERRLYGYELQLCQRYYQTLPFEAGIISVGATIATNAIRGPLFQLNQPMRTAATVTLPTAGTGAGQLCYRTITNGAPGTVGTNSVLGAQVNSFRVEGDSYTSVYSGGGLAAVLWAGSGGLTITASAEL